MQYKSLLQICILVFGNWYHLNEGRNLVNKEKNAMPKEEMNQQAKKKYKILWTKDLENKCLGTTHKIKAVICTALPWIYTHFKHIQILCISQESL